MNIALHDPLQTLKTAEDITAYFTRALANAREDFDALKRVATTEGAMSWENTFGAFDRMTAHLQDAQAIPALFGVAHAEEAVRIAARAAEPLVQAFVTEIFCDRDLAQFFYRAEEALELTGREVRLAKDTVREFRRNGALLSDDDQAKYKSLRAEVTALEQAFEVNLANATLQLSVRPESIEGLPESFLANHPVGEDGCVVITTDYPDLFPVLTYAKDREVARELYVLSENRGGEENGEILKRVVTRRKEMATLLGYATWADFVLEPRMATSPAAVKAFLATLHHALVPMRAQETRELQDIQHRVFHKPIEAPILASDVRFLEDVLMREKYHVDTKELSMYFETSRVRDGIFRVAGELFCLTFVRREDLVAWAQDVEVYDVMHDGEMMARIYLDLYPRDGKYKHAAMFGLCEGMMCTDGTFRAPIAALVTNFPKSDVAPGLMSHDGVVTFFHEFGHVLHHILSKTPYATFAGTNVARDFVEAPSQMFEEWAWQADVLAQFGQHVQTGERLPEEMLSALLASRACLRVTATERQLFLATFDQEFHTRPPGFDPDDLVTELAPQFSDMTRLPGTHFPRTFGHLMGYDAAYYSYQWSLALACDLRERFVAEGFMNQVTAKDYVATILSRGGEEDEATMVQHFLGRPSSLAAYLRFLGVPGDQESSAILNA